MQKSYSLRETGEHSCLAIPNSQQGSHAEVSKNIGKARLKSNERKTVAPSAASEVLPAIITMI
jgi:hypothetical protein